MKIPKRLLLLLSIVLFACEAKTDEGLETRTTTLRLNYYTSACAGAFFDLRCYHFQIGDEIGTDQWRTEAIYIPDFEYEYGFVYDLEVTITPNDISNCADDCPANDYELLRIITKTQVENPCSTTPLRDRICTTDYTPVCGCDQQTYSNACTAATSGLTSWTLGECDLSTPSDVSSRTASLRVNYYTSICAGSLTDLICYHFQMDDEIGTDQWRTEAIHIPDFEHEYGFIYNLEVIITPNDLSNCADDCPENNYTLLRLVSRTQVENPCRSAPKPNQVCSLDYTPVCGCDQQTYSNACIAEASGVNNWTFGECN